MKKIVLVFCLLLLSGCSYTYDDEREQYVLYINSKPNKKVDSSNKLSIKGELQSITFDSKPRYYGTVEKYDDILVDKELYNKIAFDNVINNKIVKENETFKYFAGKKLWSEKALKNSEGFYTIEEGEKTKYKTIYVQREDNIKDLKTIFEKSEEFFKEYKKKDTNSEKITGVSIVASLVSDTKADVVIGISRNDVIESSYIYGREFRSSGLMETIKIGNTSRQLKENNHFHSLLFDEEFPNVINNSRSGDENALITFRDSEIYDDFIQIMSVGAYDSSEVSIGETILFEVSKKSYEIVDHKIVTLNKTPMEIMKEFLLKQGEKFKGTKNKIIILDYTKDGKLQIIYGIKK